MLRILFLQLFPKWKIYKNSMFWRHFKMIYQIVNPQDQNTVYRENIKTFPAHFEIHEK